MDTYLVMAGEKFFSTDGDPNGTPIKVSDGYWAVNEKGHAYGPFATVKAAVEAVTRGGAWISKYSGTNEKGGNFKQGWKAFPTQDAAEWDQISMERPWRDGVEFRDDVDPGEEWEG